MKDIVENILDYMATDGIAYDIQKVQTAHRIKLVDSWGIKPGSRVLEIGCGQGDTTAVLAHFVGEDGMVHGVDIASPTYGSPITLGESAEKLKQSKLGSRIKIDFNIDILSQNVDFPTNTFDYIVFSHCSWYLSSRDELLSIMKKVKSWGKTLCLAEWSTDISSIEQYPHLLAIIIQAHYEVFKEESESNVRTLFTPQDSGYQVSC
ncbi:class I SAM-dependent methyltransferase [Ornithinibacillus scapharcae]|uniref:class I SAM-dependent methyltransferase n=1 Tax=Ornithinibacillus scapharcae TaxID=1147159 RepID=UPI000225B02F|nr:class I SAM-dependent methyltransferase [Ornithinibacillus scapharcae]